jgi:hypothetical protein
MKLKEVFDGDFSELLGVEVLNSYENKHGLKFSEKDLESFVEDTNEIIEQGLLKPNLGISHSDQQLILQELFEMSDVEMLEELPNIGLLENFRKEGKSILADIKYIPSKLLSLIKERKLFTSLSPELVKDWRETGKNIIRAVRLSNIPSMKHVPDMLSEALSYNGYLSIEDGGHNMGDVNKDLEKIIDEKLEKNTEGIVAKLSEMVSKILPKKEEKKPEVKVKDDNMVSLSEVQDMQNKMQEEFQKQLNDLNLKLVEKDKKTVQLSEEVMKQKLASKKETAEAICAKALTDGVPPVIINTLKPILLSEYGENVVKFSEIVEEKEVQVEKSVVSIVKDLFQNYPNKIKLEDISRTSLSSPDTDKNDLIEKRVEVLMKQGKTEHAARTQAGIEIL